MPVTTVRRRSSHGPESGSGSTTSERSLRATRSRSSRLSLTYQYGAIADRPSSRDNRRMDSASRPSARMMLSAASTICSSVSVGGLPRFAVRDAVSAAASLAAISALRSLARVNPLMLVDVPAGMSGSNSEAVEEPLVEHGGTPKQQA